MLNEASQAKDGNAYWKITTGPIVEPISLSEVKSWAKIDGAEEDNIILDMIQAVRESAENWLGRALLEQTITLVMDYWPDVGYIELPRPPLLSVNSYMILGEDDSESEYDSDNYYIDTISEPGRLIICQGATLPVNYDRDYAGHKITYKAGYGDETTDVPAQIRQGLLMWIASLYENREMDSKPPPDARRLLQLYKHDWGRLI